MDNTCPIGRGCVTFVRQPYTQPASQPNNQKKQWKNVWNVSSQSKRRRQVGEGPQRDSPSLPSPNRQICTDTFPAVGPLVLLVVRTTCLMGQE
jgi:hypothetical protein